MWAIKYTVLLKSIVLLSVVSSPIRVWCEILGRNAPHTFMRLWPGLNLNRGSRRGSDITGHPAMVDVPGRRGAYITMWAGISDSAVIHHVPTIVPYCTARLKDCLGGGGLNNALIPGPEGQAYQMMLWFGTVSEPTSPLLSGKGLADEVPPSQATLLQSTEELSSAWRLKVGDRRKRDQRECFTGWYEWWWWGDHSWGRSRGGFDTQFWYFPPCLEGQDVGVLLMQSCGLDVTPTWHRHL